MFRAPDSLRSSYDAVIIGGGGHGLACAYYLARDHGMRNVAVLEKSYVGSGGTGRNTAIIRSNYLNPEGVRFYEHSVRLFRELSADLGSGAAGAWRVERQECSLLIAGGRALDVFAQTCAVNVAEMGDAFFRTRIALTSCSVLRDDAGCIPAWRLWLDPSYGEYLWNALLEIVTEIGGGAVGWECLERASGVAE
jgi:glycine/D-amino acid oxidase-like deaminating enzyme